MFLFLFFLPQYFIVFKYTGLYLASILEYKSISIAVVFSVCIHALYSWITYLIMKCDTFLQNPEALLSCPSIRSSKASDGRDKHHINDIQQSLPLLKPNNRPDPLPVIQGRDTDDRFGHKSAPPTPSSSWTCRSLGLLEELNT